MRRFVLGWKKFGLERSLGSRIVTYADDLVMLCRKGKAEAALQRLREVTLAPLRALRARTADPAWARRGVGEGVKSRPSMQDIAEGKRASYGTLYDRKYEEGTIPMEAADETLPTHGATAQLAHAGDVSGAASGSAGPAPPPGRGKPCRRAARTFRPACRSS
jgi:hypothetical protein